MVEINTNIRYHRRASSVTSHPHKDLLSRTIGHQNRPNSFSTSIRELSHIIERSSFIMPDKTHDDSDFGKMERGNGLKSVLKSSKNKQSSKRPKNFCFNEIVVVGEAFSRHDYDRTSVGMTQLTPAIARSIKQELNEFKANEMPVHQDSRQHTHFFRI